ncbi:MAG: xanthine dehydrogenase family protein molybdopterin-binding subunit [Ilumatobacteraceae bacterium]|jgi:carbon-monoxide dehydrogenase large subunit|nr:xanthine dehydrogenase family protein molybdopterin-binding subunit [Ilumatobacteraceae bacterium]
MTGGSILGNRVLRKEDPKFLTSGGKYVDDLYDEPMLQGALHVTYVRSSVAHGRIQSIDTSDAASMPGVVAIFTAESLGLQPVPAAFNPMVAHTLLASDKVRYVGEPVAAVVTETREQGVDAVEAVIVDIDPLEALIDVEAAMMSSTLIYEGAGSNVVFDTTVLGIPENTGEAFFAGCEVVVTGRFMNQRVAPCPLEVRGAAAAWGPDGRLNQWLSTQHAQGAVDPLAAANGVDKSLIRVRTPDVGGGFGAKIGAYGEELLLGVIAKKVGRPVKWRETRSESMVALGHGRAQLQYVTIGGTKAGKVTHYQLHAIQDAGGFADMGTILAPFMTRPMSSGVYAIPNIECRTTSVITNTTPIVAYRGAGRPEATAAIERAMDLFALELGMDAAEVRRINLIPKFMEPHTTVVGQTYDVGDYETALDKALAASDYAALRAEQAKRRASGDVKQIGIGVSVYVEITGGVGNGESAKVEVTEDGRAIVYTGTSPHGQGHDTAWSMLVQEQTGIPMDRVELVWGDTDLVPIGTGTMGSRSLQQGGNAVFQVAGTLTEKAKAVAARLLEANEADVVLDKGRGVFHVAGTPAMSKSWADLAAAEKGNGGLMHDEVIGVPGATFPFGAHVAVVEVDTETGRVKHLRQVACDDAGKVLNPMLLDGQIHGGVAQGVAQALLEEVLYDADGNPTTSNLADYGFISAAELPSVEVVHMETPTPVNAIGAKGIGESGTIGSTPAIQSAVVDAVSHLGVRHIEMPCTAERVWQAINAAK